MLERDSADFERGILFPLRHDLLVNFPAVDVAVVESILFAERILKALDAVVAVRRFR